MLKPNAGRALSALGAILLLVSLALVWYHVERPTGTTSSTGWDTFPRLRFIVAGGAVLTLLTALPRQERPVLVARTVLGVVVAALILRRIVDPPHISSPVHPQLGVYVGLLGALAVALGGLVDSGRRVAVAAGLGAPGLRRLPPAGGTASVEPPDRLSDAPSGGAAVRAPNQAVPR
jgi:peptidoglycan/LPS O-acetylase OafA/YrhL